MTVYSTNNLPKLLNNARENGWRILGAAAEAPDTVGGNKRPDSIRRAAQGNDWDLVDDELDEDEDQTSDIIEYESASVPRQEEEQKCYNLNEVDIGPPTVLVLGSEGRGLRTLVARACSDFVKIPGSLKVGGDNTQAGVDSLNVSVSGGIFLFHLCRNR
jgi:21S rRNA (GM2251-2'-O)-methyltransferase